METLPAYRLVMPPLPATPGHWLVLASDARALADELHDERKRELNCTFPGAGASDETGLRNGDGQQRR